MKSSTLHRSGLTRERMAMLENMRVTGFDTKYDKLDLQDYKSEQPQIGSNIHNPHPKKSVRNHPDLDVLYKSVEKTFHKTTSYTLNKTPGTYLGIGFVVGFLTMLIISIIVAVASGSPKDSIENKAKATPIAVVASADKFQENPKPSEEKYVVKSGDTLDSIAVRFYGKYDNARINKIQEINNISNPASLQIGQVIVIPLN